MNESDMLQWLEELVEIPPEEDAALNELPDSFIWCRPLTRMTALTGPVVPWASRVSGRGICRPCGQRQAHPGPCAAGHAVAQPVH